MTPPHAKGAYVLGDARPQAGRAALLSALERLDVPFAVVQSEDGPAVATGGEARFGADGGVPLLAWVPALTPDGLGAPGFRADHGVRANYVAGAMANGIGSVDIVVAMARAGMLGVFGAAGLTTARVSDAIDAVQAAVPDLPHAFNLIHSPQEPWQEQETVDLYLSRGVRTVTASAFMALTAPVVQYRVTGVRPGPDGAPVPRNRLLAKVSRPEVAEHFLRPAPSAVLDALVDAGRITMAEARIARRLPLADDLIAESDSGGHTDNRPAAVLLPVLASLRDQVASETGVPVRIGLAGGIATPEAVAGAFAMGADFVLTGTVNQACREAGTSDMVRELLADAGLADVGMAPASDMFEQGVDVQVLKRGTLFAMRARQLYALYRAHDGLADIPPATRARLERTTFRRPLDEVWEECRAFFGERDPGQLARAERDPRHRMALVFRWYLGLSSRWAIAGEADRRTDTQVWCGPAIGAFNAWTAGTYLERPAERSVVDVAANLMAGGAMLTRARWLEHQGVHARPIRWAPRPVARPTVAPSARGLHAAS